MKLRYPLAALLLALTIWHILSTYHLSGAAAWALLGPALFIGGALLDRRVAHLSEQFGRPEYNNEQLDAMTTEDILIR